MAATYAIIESRIQKTIDVINTRENSNRAEIAREFRVSYDRLRSRLRDYQFKTAVRELHNRALKPDQKSALWQYLTTVNQFIDHLTKSAKTDYKLIKLASVKNICLVELLAHKL